MWIVNEWGKKEIGCLESRTHMNGGGFGTAMVGRMLGWLGNIPQGSQGLGLGEMLMGPYRGVGHMLFVRCIILGCVAYVSIGIVGRTFGWVGNQVEVEVGVGIECWWFCVVEL